MNRESGIVLRPLGKTPRWEVVITYSTPDYSERRGLDIVRRYRAVFAVETVSEQHAVVEAKIRFREAAVRSGVSWARVVELITCEPLEEKAKGRSTDSTLR